MADNLPLIPSKGEAVCADVRPVLREVFRELDQLPPLTLEKNKPSDEERLWIQNYKTQCEEIWQQEGELKKQFAKRISKKRQRNLYRLFSPKQEKVEPWRVQRGLIGRKDLMPTIEQNAGREKSLWVQNILNRSSCEFRSAEKVYETFRVPLQPVCPDAYSLQTLSYGELKVRPPPLPPSEQPPPPTPEYIICVPPQLDFVNFVLGRLHTQQVRLVNVSKFEVRLSLTPPRRRELDVELCGPRGLAVSAGSAAELKIHFRPRDVLAVHDALRVRVSVGKNQTSSCPSRATCSRPYCRELTSNGSIATGPFTLYPAWFTGGGVTRGFVQCRATATGLQTTALRILSSTATARMIHVLADSLYFSPDHVTIQAEDKDYDICSDDDPDCEYYVNLGTAFPNRPLSATVQIVNHSPVPYSYYWSTRPWGVCSCWQDELATEGASVADEDDSERLCPGAKESRAKGDVINNASNGTQGVCAQPAAGSVAARSSVPVTVSVADAGAGRGTHRAVLLLILKDIPKDSFPADLRPQIVTTRTIAAQSGPGDAKGLSHEVCEVVVGQMEVWWEVAPVRFVLDPPILTLTHSRRVTSVPVSIRATQLYGCSELRTRWVSRRGGGCRRYRRQRRASRPRARSTRRCACRCRRCRMSTRRLMSSRCRR
ncbi:uncharacterized protein [Choristoneura fumiferana]|uniref:uncharacterized protein n=1 Tax=Choristoneura fumiferana TaxID=7141 RepID=UPI003D15C8B8